MDDDVSFPEPSDLKKLIDYLETHPEAGLVGPPQQLPPNLDENERRRALQMPRSHVEAPETFRECDMVTHACLALRREDFFEVGMEHPNLISGTDLDLRNRIRTTGKTVGIVPGTRVYHPPISSWSNLIDKNFRGGRRSLYVKRNYSKYHLPADPDISSPRETQRADTLSTKIINHLERLIDGLLHGKFWWLTAQLSYLAGYGYEFVRPEDKVEPIEYPEPPRPGHPDWNNFLETLKNEGTVEKIHPRRGNR